METESSSPSTSAPRPRPPTKPTSNHHHHHHHHHHHQQQQEEEQIAEDVFPLRHGCDDSWTWNRYERSPEVRLFGNNVRIAHFHPNWSSGTAAVRGTRILNNGRYFWELQLSRRIFGTSMMFGIGTKHARLHADSFINLIGETNQSWGLSHKGLLWHNGKYTHYTRPFRENLSTKIGILFDGIDGTLTYFKDNKNLGVAFRNLNNIKEPLYPMVCSTAAKTEMLLLDTMKRDFVNLQDRCRAVIIKHIKHKCDLTKLLIPTKIRSYLADGYGDRDWLEPFKPVNQNCI